MRIKQTYFPISGSDKPKRIKRFIAWGALRIVFWAALISLSVTFGIIDFIKEEYWYLLLMVASASAAVVLLVGSARNLLSQDEVKSKTRFHPFMKLNGVRPMQYILKVHPGKWYFIPARGAIDTNNMPNPGSGFCVYHLLFLCFTFESVYFFKDWVGKK